MDIIAKRFNFGPEPGRLGQRKHEAKQAVLVPALLTRPRE
jgi:hypothetical protein